MQEVMPGETKGHFLIMNAMSYRYHEKPFLKPDQEQAKARALS